MTVIYLLVCFLFVVGAAKTLATVIDWPAARFTLDLNPQTLYAFRPFHAGFHRWHIDVEYLDIRYPTRFKIASRWDRPGAWVTTPGGQAARIGRVVRDADTGDQIKVRPLTDTEDGVGYADPVWYAAGLLSPASAPDWARQDQAMTKWLACLTAPLPAGLAALLAFTVLVPYHHSWVHLVAGLTVFFAAIVLTVALLLPLMRRYGIQAGVLHGADASSAPAEQLEPAETT